jgi:hypothetical protein
VEWLAVGLLCFPVAYARRTGRPVMCFPPVGKNVRSELVIGGRSSDGLWMVCPDGRVLGYRGYSFTVGRLSMKVRVLSKLLVAMKR